MKHVLALALALACALPATAATLTATPATLAAVQKAAKPGDVIALAPGAYGQLTVRNVAYNPALTFLSADPMQRAVFDSLYISGATGVTIKGVKVVRPATAALTSATNAVSVLTSHVIELDDFSVYGALSITGIPADSDASVVDRPGDAILGLPNGRGIYLFSSDHVTVNGCEVASFLKGVTASGITDSSVSNCDIHDIRTSSIDGGGLQRVTIADNFLHHFTPWHGTGAKVSAADHADTIHFFTKNGDQPDDALVITGNTIVDDTGSGILGINLEGTEAAGYTHVVVTGNTEVLDNTQALTTNWIKSGLIAHNAFLPTTSVDDPKHIPGIILRNTAPAPAVIVAGNLVGKQTADLAPYGPNTFLAPSFVAAHLAGASATLAPVSVAPAASDPRDAQIAALAAQLAAATSASAGQIKALTASQASLQAQIVADEGALKVANDNLAAANANSAALLAKIAAVQAALQ